MLMPWVGTVRPVHERVRSACRLMRGEGLVSVQADSLSAGQDLEVGNHDVVVVGFDYCCYY